MDKLEYDAILQFSSSGKLQQCTDTYNGEFSKNSMSGHIKYAQECNETNKRESSQHVIPSVKVKNDEGLYQELAVALKIGEDAQDIGDILERNFPKSVECVFKWLRLEKKNL